MRVAGVLRAGVGTLLAGALVLSAAPAASANDGARAAEWPLTAYGAAQLVWPHSTGKGVIVAVVDSGVRATHVDLTGQVLPGTDVVHGGNGETDYSTDGHGTGIASLIAGHGHGPNDEDGIMGLAPGAKILPVGVGNVPNTATVTQGIRYAVDHGATVINLSLASQFSESAPEEQAVAYAESKNVVVVAGAGNTGTEEDDYPASYPGVVSVSGVDQNGSEWTGSTFSSHVVVAAPAVDIVRDGDGSDTQMYKDDGTSYATAYVSAIAALIRSAYPQLTAGQVINMIIKGASLPAGVTAPDLHYGYGTARADQWALWAQLAKNPGPASGPLPQAALASSTPTVAAPTGSSHVADDDDMIALAILGGVALVLLLIVLLFVRLARSRRRKRQAAAESAAVPNQQQPPYAQPAYQPATQPYAPPPQQPGQPPYDPYGQLPQAPTQQQPPNYQPPYGGNGPYQG